MAASISPAVVKSDIIMQEKPTPPITDNGIVKAMFELTIDGRSQDRVDARMSLGHAFLPY
jgi:hypothetical protein